MDTPPHPQSHPCLLSLILRISSGHLGVPQTTGSEGWDTRNRYCGDRMLRQATPNRPEQSIQMGGLRGQDQGWESALETENKAWKARKDVRPYPVFLAFLIASPICNSLQLGGNSQE